MLGAFLSLGNLGHAGPVCVHEFTGDQSHSELKERPQKLSNKLKLECKQGKISPLVYYGLMPKFDINQKFQYDTCTDHKNVSEIYLCTKKYVDSESLIKAFNDECSNKSHCNFDMKMYLKPNFDHQVKDEDCDLEFSKLYVQYNCDFADKIAKEQLKGLFIAATAIVACIFYRCIIYFLRTTASIDYKLWDIHTVTAADFTVEVNIPEIIWRKWKKRNIKTSFKEYFRNQLQP